MLCMTTFDDSRLLKNEAIFPEITPQVRLYHLPKALQRQYFYRPDVRPAALSYYN